MRALSRRVLIYPPLLFAASALLFLRSLLYARLLPVESFGLLNQALLVGATFASFGGAGLQLLGQKVLPKHHMHGDQDAVNELLSSAVSVFGGASLIAALAATLYVVVADADSAWLVYATLLYGIAQFLFLLRLVDVKSKLSFVKHAVLSGARALLLLGAGVLVAVATRDVAAVLAVEGIVTLAFAAPMLSDAGGELLRKALRLAERRAWLTAHFPAALRLLWLNGTMIVLYALDRWAGIVLLSQREYGVFAIGLLVVLVFETLQAVVNVAAYPLMGRMVALGEHGSAFKLASILTAVVAGVTVVMYAPFVLALDYVVDVYLPSYEEAKNVIRLAVIAGALRLADFYATFAILCNREQQLARGFLAASLVVLAAIVYMAGIKGEHFDPDRMVLLTVLVSAVAFALNFSVAVRARIGAVHAATVEQ